MTGAERRQRVDGARLYLCVGIRPDLERFLEAVLAAGVDVAQLREKRADARELLRAAAVFQAACRAHGALFIVNDSVDLAIAAGADGVHLGQEDLPPERARVLAGPDLLIGRSTHAPAELRRALREPVDYIGVGPVHATPTKPGRPGVGLDYVRLAAKETEVPWFVTGGMNATTIPEAIAAGATRFVVVRAITEAADPAVETGKIRALLDA